jgi:hypothetical protein
MAAKKIAKQEPKLSPGRTDQFNALRAPPINGLGLILLLLNLTSLCDDDY